MILGYNTNGFAHHRLNDAIEIIAELGYGGMALTPDVNHLDPWDEQYHTVLRHKNWKTIQDNNLQVVIETGSRFLLDPKRKHFPTLLDPLETERCKRRSFLAVCIDVANDLNSSVLSFWSGTPCSNESNSILMTRLVEECKHIAGHAADHGNVLIAFEPEPGMFIDTMDKFAELHARVNQPNFGLTLDVGHLVCLNELPISKHIHAWKDCLWNVHLDDMKPGVHDHLMFGEGEVDFADVFSALKSIDFMRMASVELSRHSYDAVNVARKAFEFLKPFC